jgi:hypothetical protein
MNPTSLWLERDDETALYTKRRWQSRALRRVEMFADPIDVPFAEKVEKYRRTAQQDADLGAMRERSRDDATDRPWLGAKAVYPMRSDGSPEWVAALLVASLSIDPPNLTSHDTAEEP